MVYRIYKASFPNGKCYIGLTKNKLSVRISQHKSKSKMKKYQNIPFYVLMNEYGFSKIKWETLKEYSILSEAEEEERKQISSHSESCVNVLSGGMGTDNKNPRLRMRVSDGLVGRTVSEKTKEKLRMSAIKQFSTKESRKALSECAKKLHKDATYRIHYLNGIQKKFQKKFEIMVSSYLAHKPTTKKELSRISGVSEAFIIKHAAQLYAATGVWSFLKGKFPSK